MDKLHIVHAVEGDLDTLLTFSQEYYTGERYPFNRTRAAAAFRELLVDNRYGVALLAQRMGTALGYGVLTFGYSIEYHGIDAFIDELYVQPGYRGQGIGTAIIDVMIEISRQRNVQALHLEV